MRRVLTSLTVFLVIFVVFALVISPLRQQSVQLTILFFPTITTSVEAVAYVSFFIGLLVATWIAVVGDLALRRRFRAMQIDQNKRLKAASESKDATASSTAAASGEHK